MALFSAIWDFIKGLLTRPGLHTFLKKYQTVVIHKLEELAEANSGQSFNDWWDSAFGEIKAMVTADGANIRDNWIAIVMNLAWEVIKAKQEE